MASPMDEDVDASRYPAILVSGYRAPEGWPDGDDVESTQNRITVHFQKRRNGGGEVVETKLLSADVARVAFEEPTVAHSVVNREHTLKSGEKVNVVPEVMSAGIAQLSPLVTQLFSASELELACKRFNTKLCGAAEVSGAWSCLQRLSEHLTDCVRAHQNNTGQQGRSNTVAAHQGSRHPVGDNVSSSSHHTSHSKVPVRLATTFNNAPHTQEPMANKTSSETMARHAEAAATMRPSHRAIMEPELTSTTSATREEDLIQCLTILPPAYNVIRVCHRDQIDKMVKETNCEMRRNGTEINFRGQTKEGLQDCVEQFLNLYQEKLSLFHHHTVKVPENTTKELAKALVEWFREQHPTAAISLAKREVIVYGYEKDVKQVADALEQRFLSNVPLSQMAASKSDVEEPLSHPVPHRALGRGQAINSAIISIGDHPRPVGVISASSGSQRCLEQCVLPGNILLQLMDADITTQRVDAIVNAANDQLKHYGGVALAISNAGGPEIQKDSDRLVYQQRRRIQDGEAVWTKAGRLPCHFVIHAVGPMWKPYNQLVCEQSLAEACCNSLQLACQLKCQTIALPAISCGIFGMPVQVCARVMLAAINGFFAQSVNHDTSLKEVRLVLFEQRTIQAFCSAFQVVFKPSMSHESSRPLMHETSPYGAPPPGPADATSRGQRNAPYEANLRSAGVRTASISDDADHKEWPSLSESKPGGHPNSRYEANASHGHQVKQSYGSSSSTRKTLSIDELAGDPKRKRSTDPPGLQIEASGNDRSVTIVTTQPSGGAKLPATTDAMESGSTTRSVSTGGESRPPASMKNHGRSHSGKRRTERLCTYVGCQAIATRSHKCGHQSCDQCHKDTPGEVCLPCTSETNAGDIANAPSPAAAAAEPAAAIDKTMTDVSRTLSSIKCDDNPQPKDQSTRDRPAEDDKDKIALATGHSSKSSHLDGSKSKTERHAGGAASSVPTTATTVRQSSSSSRGTPSPTTAEPSSVATSASQAGAAAKAAPECQVCLEVVEKPQMLRCGHVFCTQCVTNVETAGHCECPTCRQPFKAVHGNQQEPSIATTNRQSSSSSRGTSSTTSAEPSSAATSASQAGAATEATPKCQVCLEVMKKPKVLRCGHAFCTECMTGVEKAGHYQCPTCRQPFKAVHGNQPDGTMDFSRSSHHLPGYQCGTICIRYNIPGGTQTIGHPNPGKRFSGASRTAYLPDDNEGNKVLALLKTAFDARLTFTVGRSVTSGQDNTVTWNDIHHKTSMSSGAFGYPDKGYLNRVQQELAAKGIV